METTKAVRRTLAACAVLAWTAVVTTAEPPPYTTRGGDVVDRATGEKVLLQGFGIGGWLLPEGYMWGIRTYDRPRQFEEAIIDLVGEEDAAEFWRLYYENFLTEDDVRAMKSFGANSIRIALLASTLQPRDGQPESPPYVYSEDGFRWLDRVVEWAGRHEIGVIWDMHGAPGAQNAENIADSDGEARLWTEKEVYWPRLTELWVEIAERYAGNPRILGYDLLNEPLLRRYEGVDPALLRTLYVRLTAAIREVDPHGLIFIEGDEWAQDFAALEPLDWDPHLVVAFHSYPPTSTSENLERWAKLRREYKVPLWHGETGEQSAPFTVNRRSTSLLNAEGVGWSWWTHKKLDRRTQPWHCPSTPGFRRILDYWMGRGERPAREEAREWLFEQARRTHSSYCDFDRDMVRSLEPFSPDAYLASLPVTAPEIYQQPADASVTVGTAAVFEVRALGHPLSWQWYRDGQPLGGETDSVLTVVPRSVEERTEYHAVATTPEGRAVSRQARLRVSPFAGPEVGRAAEAPALDGRAEPPWDAASVQEIGRLVVQRGQPPGRFLGLDVHVNDNDRDRREDKLAWWAFDDEAHIKPSIFGTARLVE